jgi:dolichol-phosphate mannosyltransferase
MAPTYSIVIPLHNEQESLEELQRRLAAVLSRLDGDAEVLLIDDGSSDATYPLMLELHRRDPRFKTVQLARNFGHQLAITAGIDLARGDAVVVMDGDLQHPPELLGELVDAVRRDADVAVASRYIAEGGDVAGLDGRGRRFTSRAARAAARLLLRRARSVEDPLSGFFAVRRHVVEGAPLEARGFKILLEVLVVGRWRSAVEVPLRMEPRAGGRSKAGVREGLVFGAQLSRLLRVSLSPRLRSSASSSAYVRS